MKKIAFVIAALAAIALGNTAQAAGGCNGPGCQGGSKRPGLFSAVFGNFQQQPAPTFQAAPWYLYWPYNSHFQTPAPVPSNYGPAPTGFGGLTNPYFPTYPR